VLFRVGFECKITGGWTRVCCGSACDESVRDDAAFGDSKWGESIGGLEGRKILVGVSGQSECRDLRMGKVANGGAIPQRLQ
jgi:hypothetical protein